MKLIIRAICTTFFILFLSVMFSGCEKPATGSLDGVVKYTSFRDVPGVTGDEIRAIEGFQRQGISFIYGTTPNTEAFYATDNTIKGYTALLCEWLTELFGIPFKPAIYSWGNLMAGLEALEIDFTGELTVTEERRRSWFMTDAIAERSIKYFRLDKSLPLQEIAASRPLRYAFLEGTTTVEFVRSRVDPSTFEIIFINDSGLAYDLLKSGQADAFFNEGPGELVFINNADVIARDFFPLFFEPVSMATRNPDLRSIISVVQKVLHHDGTRYLTELYNQGYHEYIKHKLLTHLTDQEFVYLYNHPVIQFAAERDNYPISFYNFREKQWQGIVFDVLKNVEDLLDIKFERINDPDTDWTTMLRILEDGEVPMVSELIRSKAREGRFIWPETAMFSNNYALLSKTDLPNLNVNEILYVRVGLIKDTAHGALFRSWFPTHKYTTEYANVDAAFSALEHGEVDMVMARESRLLDLLNYRELVGYKANVVFDEAIDATFGFNKNEPELCSILDKALRLIDTKGISGQWTRKTYDYRAKLARSQLPWLIGVAALLLSIGILLSVLFLRKRDEGKRLETLVAKRTSELERQNELMSMLNEAATILLDSKAEDYTNAIVKTMKIICRSMEVDHAHLWQNNRKEDGKLYHKEVCKWVREDVPWTSDVSQTSGLTGNQELQEFAYRDKIPHMESLLAAGKSVNGPIELLPEQDRLHLASFNVQSVLIVPIFLNDEFWGFVALDNSDRQYIYSETEENVLRSWGLLVIGAMERGRIAMNMEYTLTKLEAIIDNYTGIIWSVNNEGIIKTFNGQYLKKLGITPASLEGKKLEETWLKDKFLDIDIVNMTLSEGSQDWISDIDGKMLHSNTAKLSDSSGNALGIVGSTDDVTEMIKLQENLKDAVEAAEAASVSKSRFLANMSHEMRTPLNAIIGLAEMELNTADLEQETFVNVEKIYSAGINLLGIINDILDISKIESGKFSLIPVVYDIPSLINDTINLNIVRIGSKPIQFHLHIDGSLPSRLEGDELRIKQIFNNLLSNAIKYTDAGAIDWYISSTREGNQFRITSTVKDTGKGITEEDQKKLFKDYFQTDMKANYYVEGTGLGLSITANMIRLMGGSISVTSEYRKGSAFTVEFYQQATGEEVIGEEVATNLSQFRYAVQRRSQNQKLIRVDMSYAAVMVVDDVVTNLDVARGVLKPYKLTIDCVTSGAEAVQRVREEKVRYNAIFMDHMMPGMDGIEAVRIIREEIGTEYAKTVPIIALTANALTGNDAMFLKNGFQAFLSKPIDILRLDQVLRQWVRDKTKEKELLEKASAEELQEEKKETKPSRKLVIPGLNIADALVRFDNDEDFYLRVLASFVANAPTSIETARNSCKDLSSDDKLDTYRIAVHSLKGSGRGIGADNLGSIAEKLENAAKQKDIAYIEANTDSFVEAAQSLIATVAAFLEEAAIDLDEDKPEKGALDPELLANLKNAVENYDMAAVRDILRKLDVFTYPAHPGLIKWLQERAGKSDFDGMQKKLEAL